MRRFSFILLILCTSISIAGAEPVRFVWQGEYILGSADQQGVIDFIVHDHYAFVLWISSNAHSFSEYRSLVRTDLRKSPQTMDEYWFNLKPGASLGLWNLKYRADVYQIPQEKRIDDHIYYDDKAVYLINQEDTVFAFSHGGYIYEPKKNYLPTLSQKGAIPNYNGHPARVPFEVYGKTVKKAYLLDTVLLLQFDTEYAIINKEQFAQIGENALHYILPLQKKDDRYNELIPLLGDTYLLTHPGETISLVYHAFPDQGPITYDVRPPALVYGGKSFAWKNNFYQLSRENSPVRVMKLVHYKIQGLQEASCIKQQNWQPLH